MLNVQGSFLQYAKPHTIIYRMLSKNSFTHLHVFWVIPYAIDEILRSQLANADFVNGSEQWEPAIIFINRKTNQFCISNC